MMGFEASLLELLAIKALMLIGRPEAPPSRCPCLEVEPVSYCIQNSRGTPALTLSKDSGLVP